MKAYARALITLTNNLGQVNWNYTVELEQGPVQRRSAITGERYGKMTRTPVRTFVGNPEGIE